MRLTLEKKNEIRATLRTIISTTPYLQKMRSYQAEGFIEIVLAITQGQRPIRQLCTGGGKSIEQACLARYYYELNKKRDSDKKILLVGEKDEIIVNAKQQFKDIGIPLQDIGIIKAGHKLELGKPIQIASVPTLARRWEEWDRLGSPIAKRPDYFDLVIIDECQHSSAETYKELWQRYTKAKFVGWSATPEHKRGFVGQFDLIIPGKSQIELAHLGFQPYWECYGINCPANFDSVRTTNTGEYDPKALEEEIKKSNALLQGDILPTWKKYVADKYGVIPTILFARNVSESKAYAEEINKTALVVKDKVVKAVHVDGSMNKTAIAEALKQFVTGEATYICVCVKLLEGFDLATYAKSLGLEIKSIGCVQDLAPTTSIKKHKQKIGRARGFIFENKLKAIYLDHCGAHSKYGSPDCPYDWSLEGTAKKRGADVKRCPQEDADAKGTWGCGAIDVPKDAEKCPHCGFMFPVEAKAIDEESDKVPQFLDRNAELIPLDNDLERTFNYLLSQEKRQGWAIGEFVSYAPDYETLLAIQQRTGSKISDTFQYWLNGQRIKRNRFDWLPEFDEILEIFRILATHEQAGKFKKLEAGKPLHTYNNWLKAVRSLKGRQWLPTTEELQQIAEICGYDPKWAYTQQKLAKRF